MPDLTYLNTHANCQTEISVVRDFSEDTELNQAESDGVRTFNVMQDSAFFATVTATHELIASNEVIRTATGNVVVCEYDLPSFVFWYAEWGTNYFVEASADNKYSDLLFKK